jgi:stage II sporulation protein E
MFQNIQEKNTKEKANKKVNILSNVFAKENIFLYILAFMISTVGMGQGVSPFSLAIVSACFSAGVASIGVIVLCLIGNIIAFGANGALTYILVILVMLVTFLIKQPRYNEENRNEKIKIGFNLFISIMLVVLVKLLFASFTVYDVLVNITLAISAVLFYKIFVNSIHVLRDIRNEKVFSIEEVMGASLLIAIAVAAIGDVSIYSISIRNVLSILIVLILGLKHGILVGGTSGITVGIALGVIVGCEPIVVASYAISGFVAGVLNRFGKIGVIAGFILGTAILSYIASGFLKEIILLREILIASIGLIFVPKNISINIEEFMGNSSKLLPVFANRGLNKSKETAEKLNSVSEAIKDMAELYDEVAVTTIDEGDIIEKNRKIFVAELLNNLDLIKDNMLYDDLSKTESPIVNDLFEILMLKQEIQREDFLKVFAKHNNYIVGFDDEKVSSYLEKNINQAIKALNDAYKVGKSNFVWNEKIKENKKNIKAQLGGVSKAISKLANDIKSEINEPDKFENEKEKIVSLLAQKQIGLSDIAINKEKNGRFYVSTYFENEVELEKISIIEKILTMVLGEKIVPNVVENKKCKDANILKFLSDDKYLLTIGLANTVKAKSPVSGDSTLKVKLKDGKILVAISDGMGSGPEARKSSQIAIKMLERLLASGFDKDLSIELINTAILNSNEEIFATLDIAIFDLYKGNVEMVKSGACPTYIKNKKKVQLIKSVSLPAGALGEIKLDTFDKDLENNELFVMCSDGVIDSNVEYKNKQLWIRYLLEDIETDIPQKIADIVLNESIDNSFGVAKDDMSIIVCKISKKE